MCLEGFEVAREGFEVARVGMCTRAHSHCKWWRCLLQVCVGVVCNESCEVCGV